MWVLPDLSEPGFTLAPLATMQTSNPSALNLCPLTTNLPPPSPPAAPPPPSHPAQHSPSSGRAIPHPALPFNQLPHPTHGPLPTPHHLRTTLQLFLHPLQLFRMQLPRSSQPPRLQRPYPSPPNLLRPLAHRLPPHSQPPRHLRLPHALPQQPSPLHPPPLQPREVPSNRPHSAHKINSLTVLRNCQLFIDQNSKSLTSKYFTSKPHSSSKSLFLKDLAKINR